MPALPPAESEPETSDALGVRYPNGARIWNYHLRGKDNFEADRQAAEAVEAMALERGVPSAAAMAVEGRHLLQRMVDYMLSRGIRQFLDLGSGLPNMANTHQVARRVAPGARVVYVDIDPMVSSHAAALMAGSNVITLQADLREPDQVLGSPRVRDLIDFGQPVGILFICVLHCLWDREDPWGIVRRFRDAVAPGSCLALSHLTSETQRTAPTFSGTALPRQWIAGRAAARTTRASPRVFRAVPVRPRDARSHRGGRGARHPAGLRTPASWSWRAGSPRPGRMRGLAGRQDRNAGYSGRPGPAGTSRHGPYGRGYPVRARS
jgi:SAM-dependent methyltransferase